MPRIHLEVTDAATGEKILVDTAQMFSRMSTVKKGDPSTLVLLCPEVNGERKTKELKINETKAELRAMFQKQYDSLSKEDREAFDVAYGYPEALVLSAGD
jgi:5-methylcytosine-specific restriction endonuclease McrBC regulatory subunit McrC